MDRSNAAALVLCVVVLLAGCSASPGAPTQSRTDESTPSPSPSPSATPVQYPPGVTATGIADPFETTDAHVAALDTSYTVAETARIRFANGTLHSSDNATIRVASDRARYRYETTVRGLSPNCHTGCGNGTLTVASNGTVAVSRERYEFSNETAYRVVTTPDDEPVAPARVYHGTPRNTERLATLLGGASNVSVRTVSSGTYRVTATSLAVDSIDVDETTVRNLSTVTFTATIAGDGLVRSYTLSLQGTVDGAPVSATEQVRYSAVGSTTVDQPDWFGETVTAYRNRTNG